MLHFDLDGHVIANALAAKSGCGDCPACESDDYDPDDTSTHCIDCTCILCIPGG